MRYLKYRKVGTIQTQVSEGIYYVFISKHNIALCQVEERHIAELFMKKCGCCGSEFSCFTYATDADIALWLSPEE